MISETGGRSARLGRPVYDKDRRLAYYLGERYCDYQRGVPGYPFIPYGPLGKLRAREMQVSR